MYFCTKLGQTLRIGAYSKFIDLIISNLSFNSASAVANSTPCLIFRLRKLFAVLHTLLYKYAQYLIVIFR